MARSASSCHAGGIVSLACKENLEVPPRLSFRNHRNLAAFAPTAPGRPMIQFCDLPAAQVRGRTPVVSDAPNATRHLEAQPYATLLSTPSESSTSFRRPEWPICRRRSKIGRHRPQVGRSRPRFGRHRLKFGQLGPSPPLNSVESGPSATEIREINPDLVNPAVDSTPGQVWPKLVELGSTSVELGPKLVNFGRHRIEIGRCRPKLP